MRRYALAAAVLAASFATTAQAPAATEFIGTIWYPQTHPLDKYGYEDWAKTVIERSKGDLKPKIFYGTALLPAQAHLSGLKDGIAQLSHHAGTYTPKELPEDNTIAILSMGLNDTMVTAMAISDFSVNDPEMQARYKQHGIVYGTGFATPPYILMCTKPINSLADLKGLKIRTPGTVQADWARSVGAVPVTVPSTEMFTGLEKGQLDCAANGGNDLKTRSLWDVAKFTSLNSLGLYYQGWQYAYNKAFWRKLKPEQRRILLDTMAEALPKTMIGYINASEEALKEAPSKGVKISQPAPDVAKSISEFAAKNGREQAIKIGKERFGLKDPEGLVNRFEATYKKWEKLLANVDRKDAAALAKIFKDNVYSKIDEKTYGVN